MRLSTRTLVCSRPCSTMTHRPPVAWANPTMPCGWPEMSGIRKKPSWKGRGRNIAACSALAVSDVASSCRAGLNTMNRLSPSEARKGAATASDTRTGAFVPPPGGRLAATSLTCCCRASSSRSCSVVIVQKATAADARAMAQNMTAARRHASRAESDHARATGLSVCLTGMSAVRTSDSRRPARYG